ncbi:hypothetical protein Hanom_Chr06g00559261 [Helianthus anomalus]
MDNRPNQIANMQEKRLTGNCRKLDRNPSRETRDSTTSLLWMGGEQVWGPVAGDSPGPDLSLSSSASSFPCFSFDVCTSLWSWRRQEDSWVKHV